MKKDSVRFTVCIHKELFERLDYVSTILWMLEVA